MELTCHVQMILPNINATSCIIGRSSRSGRPGITNIPLYTTATIIHKREEDKQVKGCHEELSSARVVCGCVDLDFKSMAVPVALLLIVQRVEQLLTDEVLHTHHPRVLPRPIVQDALMDLIGHVSTIVMGDDLT